jgi:putative ABC transport system ATP-binding protein
MENGTIVQLENMVKNYPVGNGHFTALKDINIKFEKSEFTGIVGPSGSGKTTLLNIIGSLDVPTKGHAMVMNKSVGDLSSKASAQLRSKYLGFIFQTYNLLPVYTVFENVEFPLLLLGLPSSERKNMVMEALKWVNLLDKIKSRPNQLSGGQSQRVAIARAIVKKPTIILADEPTANLDAENSHHILQLLEKINSELGTTFIFSTHDEKVMKYVRRKISLLDGRVASDERY